jgi:formyl-CoA transferase/CoA:oxalate CoA-transferase
MQMAAYGARVYKIEGVDHGDMGRTWGPPFLPGGESAYFLGINSSKQGLAIDVKHPQGLALCRKLISKADILVENLRPGTMDRLGLGYEATRVLNDRLIYCSISGFGQNGPARDDAAMDLILQAASGLISVTGTPGGELARCGHSVADVTAGMFALIGALMALRVREQTGKGQWVDVAMLDSMISAMASNYAQFLGAGIVPKPMGTAFATIVPYACFPTADRPIAIAVASEKLWRNFCHAVHPAWIDEPKYATNALRVKHRDEFEPLLTTILQTKPAAEWARIFAENGVPCSPVNDMAEVAALPQVAHREMFPSVEHPDAGPVRVTGLPVKMSAGPMPPPRPAPRQGEHTIAALRELLALTDSELAALNAAGAIR